MDGLLTSIILIASVATLVLGILVLAQESKSEVNRSFFLMALLGSLWIPFAYFGGNIENIRLSEFLIRGDYVVGIMLLWSFWNFSRRYYLSIQRSSTSKYENVFIYLSLLIAVISSLSVLSDSVVEISVEENSVNVSETPLFIVFYIFPAITYIVLGVFNLFNARQKATFSEKIRSNLIFLSLLGTVIIVGIPFLFANFIYDGDTDLGYLQQLAILGFFIFVSGTAYAIVKHQLFDVRAAIARSVAYVLSLGTMLVLYVALIFVVTDVFIDSAEIDNSQRLLYAIFAVLIAFTFQPLKSFFDRLTDKIFYRNKYDPQKLLSDYSDYLVDEINTDKVIKHTLELLNEISNPSEGYVVLYKEGMGVWYDINGPNYGDEGDSLAKALEYQSASVYLVDDTPIQQNPFMGNIKKQMDENSLRVSVRLSTHGQLEGFILLGEKKSGSRYTQQDLKFFVTIANELSVSIQNSQRFDQIQRFNITLQKEVEEATARLKQTNQKLKALDQAKDEFISMASHQLRTPLTSVKGYISMLIEGDAGDVSDEQKKLLNEAFTSSQRMVFLISDLLNISRLKTGKFVIERSEVFLPTIVQEEVDQLTQTAMTRNIMIYYSPPKNFPMLNLDETKSRQVVMNFIDNAIYYTKSGGEIHISLTAKKDQVEYRVKDTGIGIPAKDQHKLFTKFFRASNARSARPDGTGLGLYMSQKIISAQGGSIIFKSKVGKGSTFGFNIPLKGESIVKKSKESKAERSK